MNTFALLFVDELRGFYKSKVMAVLWIGMPLLSIFMHFLQPNAEGIPITALVGLLVASVGGTLASVMLSTSIVAEKNHHVYELFLIRAPSIRNTILLAKFLAVYACLATAAGLSLVVGLLIDGLTLEVPLDLLLRDTGDSLAISLAAMAIACSIGILLGVLIKSVPTASILSIYLGAQLSLITILPAILIEGVDPVVFAALIGSVVTVTVLVVDVLLFRKKQF